MEGFFLLILIFSCKQLVQVTCILVVLCKLLVPKNLHLAGSSGITGEYGAGNVHMNIVGTGAVLAVHLDVAFEDIERMPQRVSHETVADSDLNPASSKRRTKINE